MRVLDLFSGIGGFSLGLERTGGFRTAAFCEIDDKARRVLQKHWPNVTIYSDVATLTAETVCYDVGTIDVITGGFPCQDISLAGRGAGLSGARSGLWFHMRRLIEEIRPRYAIIENVSALRSRGLDVVLRGLAALGYDAEWHCIPASAVGAPHRRDRVWIVAYTNNTRLEGLGLRIGSSGEEVAMSAGSGGIVRRIDRSLQWEIEPDVGRVAHGLPNRMDRLKQLGNAVVPQIVQIIGESILAYDRWQKEVER